MVKHVMEAMGRARVVIEDGRVVEVGEPLIDYCPLFKKYRGIDKLDENSIRENIEFRIRDFGMCTSSRSMYMDDFLSFGVSELLCLAVGEGLLDAAVIASDGAGTCVVDDPRMIQGLGGRISGIVSVEAVPEVVDAIGAGRTLEGRIDQIEGVELARSLGFKRLGVTLTDGEDAAELRRRYGDDVMLFAVHTTGVDEDCALKLFENCDIVTGCASLHIRNLAKDKALLQGGDKVPVYAANQRGKGLMEMKLRQLGKEPSVKDSDDLPRPLV